MRILSTLICDGYRTFCISKDNNCFIFGSANFNEDEEEDEEEEDNQLLHPQMIPTLQNIKSMSCLEMHFLCIDNDGNVYTFPINEQGELRVDETLLSVPHIPLRIDLPPCIEVSCGLFFSLCLSVDGLVYSFGITPYGERSNKDSYSSIPQLIPSLKKC